MTMTRDYGVLSSTYSDDCGKKSLWQWQGIMGCCHQHTLMIVGRNPYDNDKGLWGAVINILWWLWEEILITMTRDYGVLSSTYSDDCGKKSLWQWQGIMGCCHQHTLMIVGRNPYDNDKGLWGAVINILWWLWEEILMTMTRDYGVLSSTYSDDCGKNPYGSDSPYISYNKFTQRYVHSVFNSFRFPADFSNFSASVTQNHSHGMKR